MSLPVKARTAEVVKVIFPVRTIPLEEDLATASNGSRYNVGGMLPPRPFKARRLGHFDYNALRMDEGRDFYANLPGFRPSDVLPDPQC